MQSHEIIMWAKPKDISFEETSVFAYKLVSNFIDILNNINIDILYYNNKEGENIVYEHSLENIQEILCENINSEDGKSYEDLGCSFSIFSDPQNQDRMICIDLTIGTKNERFEDTLIISISNEFMDMIKKDILEKYFLNFVDLFTPYWGAFINEYNALRFDDFYENQKPTSIHWLNFLDSESIKNIGIDYIENSSVLESRLLSSGIFIKLKDSPIDDYSEYDIELQKKVNNQMKLL